MYEEIHKGIDGGVIRQTGICQLDQESLMIEGINVIVTYRKGQAASSGMCLLASIISLEALATTA